MKDQVFLVAWLLSMLFSLPSAISQIGFRAGPAISDIAFVRDGQTPYLGYEINSLEHRLPMLAFQAGAFATMDITKRLEFQPELLFVRQGLDYSTKYLYDKILYKIKINYLQTPLLLRYKIVVREKRQSGFIAGPYASLKLNAFRLTEIDGIREKSVISNMKTIDFGIIAGASMDINLPSGKLVVDLRTGFSLINMMDRMEGYIPWYLGPSKGYARNVSIALTVGYRFSDLWANKKEPE